MLFDAIIDVWGKHWAKKSQSSVDTILPLIHQFSKIIILLIGIFIILSEVWGKDLTGFFAGLGVAGIIIGLALKDSFSNIFSGISIILDKNYKVGDRIKVESGDTGIVYDISLRSTRIKNWDNEMIIIPNGKMANSKIHNYVQPDVKARSVIEFGVAYGSDINKVKDVVLNTVKKIENVLEEPAPSVIFSKANDFSLDFNARFWVDDVSKRFTASEQARCMIHESLLKAGIKIPFPTRTIYMKK
jgi:MscS family membrane protein